MNSNDVQNQSEQLTAVPATQSAEPSARRRLLLKGALSAPVIMTLYSGAALARSSNWITTTADYSVNGNADLDLANAGDDDNSTTNGLACAVSDDSVGHDGCGKSPSSPGDKCDLGDNGFIYAVSDKDQCDTQGGVLVHASHACSSFWGATKEDIRQGSSTDLKCGPLSS